VSNNAQSNVTVTFMGVSQNLDEALKSIHAGLASTGTEATAAGDKLAKMSESEAKTAHEARNMGEAVKVAADEVELLGIESGGSYIKLQALRHGVTDFTASMGGLKAGLIGGIGLGAAFGGLAFLKSSIEDSIAGEQATDQLRAALVKVPGAFQQVNDSIDKGAGSWARYGVAVGTLRAAVAQGVGAGIKPETIIGQPSQIADLAKALGEDIPSALGEIERGGRGADRVISRLNLSLVDQRRAMQQLANPNFSANDRTQFLLNLVQKTSFAGQGEAGTKGARGQIVAFDASLANLKETVGTGILPVFTDMISSFSGLIQGANSMLSAVGGLSTFLQATWKPALIGISTIFLGLKISHSALGDFIRSRLLGDVSAASGGFAEEAVQATKAGDAIAAIPPVARTIAIFDDAAGVAIKEPWIANVLSVPKVALTTAVFDNAAAVGAMAAEEGQLAAIPRAVTTVATVDTAQVAGAVAAEEGQLAAIPKTVTSMGTFVPASAEVTAYEASLNAIPKAETTTAAFIPATAAVTAYEGELGAIPKIITTTAVFTPGSIPSTIAVTAAVSVVATATQVLFASGALDGIKSALGHLVGTVTHAYPVSGLTVHVPGVADVAAAVAKNATVTIDNVTVGKIKLPANEQISVKVNPKVGAITLPKGTTFTATGKGEVTSISVKPGTTIQIGGTAEINSVRVKQGITVSNVHGTVQIDNATVAPGKKLTVGNVGGTAIIDNVVPAPGKHLTISGVKGSAEIDGVTLKKGATVQVSGGTATIDTLRAKAVSLDVGAISGALGFSKNKPAPYYIKYEAINQPPKPPTAHGGGGGGGGFDYGGAAVNVGANILESVVTMLLFKKFMGGGGGGTGGGGTGAPLGDVNKQVDSLLESLSGATKTVGKGAAVDTGAQAKKLLDSLLNSPDAKPSTDITHIDPSLFQQAFDTGLKAVKLATPLGLLIGGAFAAKGLVPVVSTALENIVTLAFKSIKMPALHLDTTVKLPALHFDMGGMLGDINKQLVSWGPALGTLIIGGLILGLTRGRVEIPALAKLAGAHAAAPDPFNTTYDPKTHKFRQMTQKEQDARTVKDNAGEAAMFKGLGQWFATNIIGGIKFDAGKIHDAGVATVTTFSDAVKGGWSALTQRISALFNDLINAVIGPINSLLSHIPGTHPIPLAGAHTSSSSPHGGSKGTGFNLASINPAVLHPPAHVMAYHAPVVHHHTTHHTAHQTTTVNVGGIHISEAKTPQATGDAVLKALSAAAQRKTRHGR